MAKKNVGKNAECAAKVFRIILNVVGAVVFLGLIAMLLSCQGRGKTVGSSASDSLEMVRNIKTVQSFAGDSIPNANMQIILDAGINSPSAMNKQPWHFSVVTDKSVLEDIQSSMKMPNGFKPPKVKKAGLTDAPVAIVISCADNSQSSQFDAGLACQNMSVAANLLGYGTKIISSPNIALNGDRKEDFKRILNIPSDMSAVAVLLVGKASDVPDGVSAASVRKSAEEVVSFI